ncbi:hypothetical protein TH53_18715, partial [Pedobacter lusitanus]
MFLNKLSGLPGWIACLVSLFLGVVRDAVLKWFVKTDWYKEDYWYTYPVVAETYDGIMNDIYGFHVKEEHVYEALNQAKSG